MKTQKTVLTAEEKELAGLIAKQCKNQGDIHEVLKRLFAGTVEEILEAEMEEHLGYEKNSAAGRNSGSAFSDRTYMLRHLSTNKHSPMLLYNAPISVLSTSPN